MSGAQALWQLFGERLPRQPSLSALQALTAGAVFLGGSIFRWHTSQNRSRSHHLLNLSLFSGTGDSKDLEAHVSWGYIAALGGGVCCKD